MLERCDTIKVTNGTKASPYWKCIHDYYQEYKSYVPYKIANYNSNSLQHRWGIIQGECNKFTGTYDAARSQTVSGVGVAIQVP
jgi:hypothetical protein